MKVGVRGKLFAVSLVLLLGVGLVSGLYLESQLRHLLAARIADELRHDAGAAAELMQLAQGDSPAQVDPLADRLGKATDSRITIIRQDGVVLGDSELDLAAVRAVENHSDRPEVRAAFEGEEGLARRYSVTVEASMLYVALPYVRPDGQRGVARASMPLAEVDEAVAALRIVLAIAGVLGLAVAVVMSWLASHLMTRTFRALVESARDISAGKAAGHLPPTSEDELGGLAGSLRRLTRELERGVIELREERDRLGTILEGMSDAVLALDEQQRITLANRAALQLLGQRGLEGRALVEVVRAPQLAELVKGASGGADEFDLGAAAPRRILARVAPLTSTGGSVLVMHDITEIRRLETIRRDFVANVSHELRTPVSVIQANAETLLGGALDDPTATRRFVEAMGRNAARLGALLSDLLDLSRIEAGQYALDVQPISLGEAVGEVVQALAEAARARSVTVESTIDSGLQVRADAHALEQVLSNLLENAIKYTREGGHVWIRARDVGGRTRVEVSDDGPGIEPRHRGRIFERFYRVDAGRSQDMGGTGLGLAIVKHLVTSQGGEVGFEPHDPDGSTFWFTLTAA